ncbi:MAG: hypothetical protein QOK37_1312 [Thermoanaerobaculia bacterium]|jgi:hypothetical protein|nr:hypothetical protein [Thermoanaerobaculia bacterium]
MSVIDASETASECASCHARYHDDCWTENGGCAVYGCSQVPKTEGLKALEIPPAYWGREDKSCPRCGSTIMALAVRCRHCGAEVVDRPEERLAYERRAERKERAPTLRRSAIIFVVMSVLPLFSLMTLVGGTLYYRRNRDEIRKLSGGTDGLFRISIVTAAGQCGLLALGLVAWWLKGAFP